MCVSLPGFEILTEAFWKPGATPCCFSSVGIYSVRLWNSSCWRPARRSPREAQCVTIGGRFTFPREHCAPVALERQGEGSALARSLARSPARSSARTAGPRSYPRCPAEHRPTRPFEIHGAAGRAGNWYLPMRTRAWIFLGGFQKGALKNIRHFRRREWEGTGQWAVWGTRSATGREPQRAWGPRSHGGACRGRKGTWDGGAREGAFLSPEGSGRGSRKTRPHPPRFRQVQASLGATWRARASRGGRGGAWHHWHRPLVLPPSGGQPRPRAGDHAHLGRRPRRANL